jgi:hypothetical protein
MQEMIYLLITCDSTPEENGYRAFLKEEDAQKELKEYADNSLKEYQRDTGDELTESDLNNELFLDEEEFSLFDYSAYIKRIPLQ